MDTSITDENGWSNRRNVDRDVAVLNVKWEDEAAEAAAAVEIAAAEAAMQRAFEGQQACARHAVNFGCSSWTSRHRHRGKT
jgi:hypothetical protein